MRLQCAGQIGSMLELLQGQLSSQVMGIVTEPAKGLFPQPREIKLHCDCPDWADMCKHVSAVLYGVGARLDEKPELLFKLREVDHEELISAELDLQAATTGQGKRRRLVKGDLSNIFGIDIAEATTPDTTTATSQEREFRPTGAAVARLRMQLGMTRSQFAGLIRVSPGTVANWERKGGRLKLQKRTLEALTRAWLRN